MSVTYPSVMIRSFYVGLFFVLSYNPLYRAQKLIVIIADGISGNHYHKFFQENGIWSTLLYPEFPTLTVPNRQTIMTGMIPKSHGFIGDYMYNSVNGQTFLNFEQTSDLSLNLWWKYEPVFVTAQKAGAPTALLFFPECRVRWKTRIAHCVSSEMDDFSNVTQTTELILKVANENDFTMINYAAIRTVVEKSGLKQDEYTKTGAFQTLNEIIIALQKVISARIDMNLIVVSPHGFIDVPIGNDRILDNYIAMELINTTVGFGALKQIIGYPGKTHQIYSQLRYISPIPNVKIYYTATNVGDIPVWYHYKKSDRISDLVLIATPGYAIYTRDETKQIPLPSKVWRRRALSGYNNHYPDMLGLMLAYGPLFQAGMRKGPMNLVDIYDLICVILRLQCPNSSNNFSNISDILKIEHLYSRSPIQFNIFISTLAIFLCQFISLSC